MNSSCKIFLLLACIFLSACASSKSIILPSGAVGYFIDCSGVGNSMAYCMQEASLKCPNGYKIVDRLQKTETYSNLGAVFDPMQPAYISKPVSQLVIQCKK